MRTGITDRVCGYYVIRSLGARTVNLFMAQAVRTWGECTRDGCRYYCISAADYKRLPNDCFETVRERGLPQLIRRYRKRPGIALGLLLFVTILWLSTMFVWRVDVKGCERLNKTEVVDLLDSLGCGVGSFIPSLDCYKISNRSLYTSDKLAWLTVNMKGTTAYVELREYEQPQRDAEHDYSEEPANIVAQRSGVVQRLEVFSGRAVVKAGEYVEKGQLLISGVIESKRVGLYLTRAKGRVIAQTSEIIEYTQPPTEEVKVRTGEIIREKKYNIFGKILNLTLKEWTLPQKYDIIIDEEQVTLFDEITLPVTCRTTLYTGWTMSSRTLTEDEMRLAAWERVNRLIAERFGKTDILSRVTDEGMTDDGYTVSVFFTCEEDIGQTTEYGN